MGQPASYIYVSMQTQYPKLPCFFLPQTTRMQVHVLPKTNLAGISMVCNARRCLNLIIITTNDSMQGRGLDDYTISTK